MDREGEEYMAGYNEEWNALIEEFRVIMKSNIKDVEKALSAETDYSAASIRRFKREGYPKQTKMEQFIKGVIRLAHKWKMPKAALTEKLLAYCREDFRRCEEKYIDGEIRIQSYINELYMEPYENNTLGISEDELKNVVELDSLKEKIVKFCNSKKEELLYIFGFPGTGMEKSVFKILQGITEKMISINCDTDEERSWIARMNRAREQAECIVVWVGKKNLPGIFYDAIKTKRIIVLANCPAENYYDERINSISFNDYCNNKKDIYNMTSQALQRCGVNNEDVGDSKEKILGMIQFLTGGVPPAVKELMSYFESEMQYTDDIQAVIDECWSLGNRVKENVFKKLSEKILYSVLNELHEDTKSAVAKIIYFDGDVSIDLWRYILKEPNNSIRWRNAFDDSIKNLILLESGRTVNTPCHEVAHHGGIRFLPLIKTLLRSCVWSDEEKDRVYNMAIEYYMQKSREINDEQTYTGKKIFLDRGNEMQVLMEVLRYCDEKGRDDEFLEITRNLRYFFNLRGKWRKEIEEIYQRRLVIAERAQKHASIMDTYAHLINMSVKYSNKSKAKEYKKNAEEYIVEKHMHKERTKAYRHAMALFEVLIENEPKKALAIWEDLLQEDGLSERDRLSAEKWKRKCLFKMEEKDLFDLLEDFGEGYAEAYTVNSQRLIVDYAIYQSYICLKIYYSSDDDTYLDDAMAFLKDIREILFEQSDMDDKYRADYYAVMCYIKKIKREDIDLELREAKKYYGKQNMMASYARLRRNLYTI